MTYGCDAADHLADAVLDLRAQLAEKDAEIARLQEEVGYWADCQDRASGTALKAEARISALEAAIERAACIVETASLPDTYSEPALAEVAKEIRQLNNEVTAWEPSAAPQTCGTCRYIYESSTQSALARAERCGHPACPVYQHRVGPTFGCQMWEPKP